jgi:hypothetical protein
MDTQLKVVIRLAGLLPIRAAQSGTTSGGTWITMIGECLGLEPLQYQCGLLQGCNSCEGAAVAPGPSMADKVESDLNQV